MSTTTSKLVYLTGMILFAVGILTMPHHTPWWLRLCLAGLALTTASLRPPSPPEGGSL